MMHLNLYVANYDTMKPDHYASITYLLLLKLNYTLPCMMHEFKNTHV